MNGFALLIPLVLALAGTTHASPIVDVYDDALITEKRAFDEFRTIRAIDAAGTLNLPLDLAKERVNISPPTRSRVDTGVFQQPTSTEIVADQRQAIRDIQTELDDMIIATRQLLEKLVEEQSNSDPGMDINLDELREEMLNTIESDNLAAEDDGERARDMAELMESEILSPATQAEIAAAIAAQAAQLAAAQGAREAEANAAAPSGTAGDRARMESAARAAAAAASSSQAASAAAKAAVAARQAAREQRGADEERHADEASQEALAALMALLSGASGSDSGEMGSLSQGGSEGEDGKPPGGGSGKDGQGGTSSGSATLRQLLASLSRSGLMGQPGSEGMGSGSGKDGQGGTSSAGETLRQLLSGLSRSGLMGQLSSEGMRGGQGGTSSASASLRQRLPGLSGNKTLPIRSAGTTAPTDAGPTIPARRISTLGGDPAEWIHINSWYILGPFPNPSRRNIDVAFPPEALVDLDATYTGQNGPIRWTFIQSPDEGVRPIPDPTYAIYYAYTEIWSDIERDLWIALGSDDNSRVWINNQLVWKSGYALKDWRRNEGFRRVRFQPGINRILYRVENGHGSTAFSFIIGL